MTTIILGTAQFGMDYGIRNAQGKMSRTEALAILQAAVERGIDMVDTAGAYGDSEEVIGVFMQLPGKKPKVISKLPPGCSHQDVERALDASLHKLHCASLEGFLVHAFSDYTRDNAIWEVLRHMRESGKVRKIGFSLYYPTEVEALFNAGLDIDIVQIPFNVVDQRFSRHVGELKKRGVAVHARSVFLQGLLLSDPALLGVPFAPLKEPIDRLQALAARSRIPLLELCLNFVSAYPFAQAAVVGVDRMDQFLQILAAAHRPPLADDILQELISLRIDNEDILLPFKWKRKVP